MALFETKKLPVTALVEQVRVSSPALLNVDRHARLVQRG
jgi:hypothetical protein